VSEEDLVPFDMDLVIDDDTGALIATFNPPIVFLDIVQMAQLHQKGKGDPDSVARAQVLQKLIDDTIEGLKLFGYDIQRVPGRGLN
jgi:hypothetical protein